MKSSTDSSSAHILPSSKPIKEVQKDEIILAGGSGRVDAVFGVDAVSGKLGGRLCAACDFVFSVDYPAWRACLLTVVLLCMYANLRLSLLFPICMMC